MSTNEIPMTNDHRARSARNRENAKQRSPLMAFRHGFTGQTFVMTAEDLAAYQRLTKGFVDDLKPQGFLEKQFVQFLIDLSWRLNRIPAIENNLLIEQPRLFNVLSMYRDRLGAQFERTYKQLCKLQSKRRHPKENKTLTESGFVFSDDVPRSRYPS
jgi:hypothetical protein